jgi:hypothetical protein
VRLLGDPNKFRRRESDYDSPCRPTSRARRTASTRWSTDSVAAFLTRRVGRDVAQDLAQETFVTAFRRRDRFDARYDTARPWLLGIATFPTEPKALATAMREAAAKLQLHPGTEPTARDYTLTAMAMIFDRRQTPPDVL